MNTQLEEPECIAPFREWIRYHGAWIHPALRFVGDDSGMSVVAAGEIAADTPVLCCPFDLVITPQSSKAALKNAYGDLLDSRLDQLSDRQLMVAYILMHFLNNASPHFKHGPYLRTLPGKSQLLTPLFWNEEEMKLLTASNVALETKKREEDWRRDLNSAWPVFQRIFGAHLVFTGPYWEKACTWLSSRAFPSSLLSVSNPNARAEDSVPVLLPVIDCLNHKRAHPVTWLTSGSLLPKPIAAGATDNRGPYVTLVHHPRLAAGDQVFNNYGPKGNAEFLLGYGFTLPDNPDDTILLALPQGPAYEIGREAAGIMPLWNELRERIKVGSSELDDDNDLQNTMDAAQAMSDMILVKLEVHDVDEDEVDMDKVRPLVRKYARNYMEGQRDILQSMYEFCQRMQAHVVERAREEGLELREEMDEDSDVEYEKRG